MKHSSMIAVTVLFLSFFVLGFSMLLVSGRTVGYLKQMKDQRAKVHAVESLDSAQRSLQKGLEKELRGCAEDEYEELSSSIIRNNLQMLDEKTAEDTFQKGYIDRVERLFCDKKGANVLLNQYLSAQQSDVVKVDMEQIPWLEPVTNKSTGEVNECILHDIRLVYEDSLNYSESRCCEFSVSIPRADFFEGNDELFSYSLIGRKGIYVTGRTSSVVGNIFAGTHPVSEYRKAEAAYGEKDTYGGFNVLSTQLGIQADTLISAGDINLKGAFVIFGTKDAPISIYTDKINKMDTYLARTDYNIEGTEILRNTDDDSSVVSDSDVLLTHMQELLETVCQNNNTLEYYYNSTNDENYQGAYDMILADGDVVISKDLTGIVLSTGNVIVESDCNVEGLILAEDRIYVQGNNNIVSNREILRKLLSDKHEISGQEQLLTEFLGGLSTPGLHDDGITYAKLLRNN